MGEPEATDRIDVYPPDPEPEPTEPAPEGTETTELEPEPTEPEATGTGTEPQEPEGKVDQIPQILDDIRKQMKKLHDRYGYLQRQVENIRVEPPKPTEPEAPTKPKPKEEDFETFEEFIDALTDWKLDQRLEEMKKEEAQKEMESSTSEKEIAFQEKLNEGRSKYDDFDDVVFNPTVPITHAIVDILKDSDIPEEIAYYLGKNPKDCAMISRMPPIQAARAIGRIEAEIRKELSTNPKPKPKVPSAPPPIKPIKTKEVITKDPEKMTQAEYEAWRRSQKQG